MKMKKDSPIKYVLKFSIVMTFMITAGEPVSGNVIYVPGDFPVIQDAINNAVTGDTVLIADGTYTGTGNRNIDFQGKSITVTSKNGPENCVIDCENEARGFIFQSRESWASVMSDLTISNGFTEDYGGGILMVESCPWVHGCILINNHSTFNGGGIFCFRPDDNTTVKIQSCVISDNKATRAGGGICIYYSGNVVLTGLTVTRNNGSSGAGIYVSGSPDITISDCIISDNYSGTYSSKGGGLLLEKSRQAIIDKCIVSGNSANSGSGISMQSTTDSVISNCIIHENGTSGHTGEGAGLDCCYSDPLIINCIFYDNYLDCNYPFGGGIAVVNQTPWGTTAHVVNTILWNNDPNQLGISESEPFEIFYSNIQDGFDGTGNIDSNPLFVGKDPFDFHFLPESPCIDSGTDENAPDTDLDHNSRPCGGSVDMGVYEYSGWPPQIRTYIEMPSHDFYQGDAFSCHVTVWNSTDQNLYGHPLFVILDILDQFYFAPSFSELDYYLPDLPPGMTFIDIVQEFAWSTPDGGAEMEGVLWYASLVNPEMTALFGHMDVFEFSCH
jgi:parallel beta-helix repeat protein